MYHHIYRTPHVLTCITIYIPHGAGCCSSLRYRSRCQRPRSGEREFLVSARHMQKLPFPRGPHPPPHGERGKLRGNPTGRNHGSSGYVNNTRVEVDQDPDRHCFRPTSKGKMKCSRCYDYNSGVRRGVCRACGFNRFDPSELEEALEAVLSLKTRLWHCPSKRPSNGIAGPRRRRVRQGGIPMQSISA